VNRLWSSAALPWIWYSVAIHHRDTLDRFTPTIVTHGNHIRYLVVENCGDDMDDLDCPTERFTELCRLVGQFCSTLVHLSIGEDNPISDTEFLHLIPILPSLQSLSVVADNKFASDLNSFLALVQSKILPALTMRAQLRELRLSYSGWQGKFSE
jgi:hypothetical protein